MTDTKHPEAAGLSELPRLPSPEYDRLETLSGVCLYGAYQMRAYARLHEAEVTRRNAEKHERVRAALAPANKLLRDFFEGGVGYYRSRELMAEVSACIDVALSAEPGEKP